MQSQGTGENKRYKIYYTDEYLLLVERPYNDADIVIGEIDVHEVPHFPDESYISTSKVSYNMCTSVGAGILFSYSQSVG